MWRLITLNTARKKSQCQDLCKWLGELSPDVVALQEVTPSTIYPLSESLHTIGLHHIEHTVPERDSSKPQNRSYGVLIATRFPMHIITPPNSPWPEKVSSVRLSVQGVDIEIHTAHIPPGSSNGWVKVDVLESIFRVLSQPTNALRVLCGDFNTPQAELDDGTVVTWAQRIRSDGTIRDARTIRGTPAIRWDQAERNILSGLYSFGLPDIYRRLHGYSADGYSWVMHRKGNIIKRRYDHIFASPALQPSSCEYLHEVRELGLSDHSALVADFSL